MTNFHVFKDECKSQSMYVLYYKYSNELLASLFLDRLGKEVLQKLVLRLGRQGNAENFSILLKYPTFEGGFLHIFMGKKILKIEILQKLINIKVRKLSILA